VEKLDLKNQSYVGQDIHSVINSEQLDSSVKSDDRDLWLQKGIDFDHEIYREMRARLDSASDKEILESYYRMRDERIPRDTGFFYPNIQTLFGTPLEREKDRREIRLWNEHYGDSEVIEWYRQAKEKPCVWWVENHIVARHALHSCMSCGNCTSLCPAAEFFDYNPRIIMETVQNKEEDALIDLLKSETLWYCSQCGSCKTKCPRQNNPFGMISSLRQLSQIKGYHINSIRGRQQYAGRHLWGGNLWNRACTLYFRNPEPDTHRDFGPRYEAIFNGIDENFRKIGACPDMEGSLSGRKVTPETLDEVRRIWHITGSLYLWELIEETGQKQADELGLTIDEYHDKVKTEG
jgi:heterodisulfide reductase subunit C1